MYTRTFSCTSYGTHSKLIDIEIDITDGYIPSFNIVGLIDKSVQESKERISSAITNSGFSFPKKRIIVNLAPADLNKKGSQFDLAIAIGILISDQQIPPLKYKTLIAGELSLDGSLNPNLPFLSPLILAKSENFEQVFMPSMTNDSQQDYQDILSKISLHIKEPVNFHTLLEVILFIRDGILPKPTISKRYKKTKAIHKMSLYSQISGQFHAKKALEIAVAGKHHLLMHGSPGSGKTMLSKAIIDLLPELTPKQIIECTQIYQAHNRSNILVTHPPYRSPHHTATDITLIGGGRNPSVGEVSLAHNGVLFLDEFPEFSKKTIDALRQPIEENHVTISRLGSSLTFPTNFIFIASMNPCKCGYYGHSKKTCVCSPGSVISYQQRISGPILDRIDLRCFVSEIEEDHILKEETNTLFSEVESIKDKIIKAIDIQKERFVNFDITSNSQMTRSMVIEFCKLSDKSRSLMKKIYEKFNMTVRGYIKVLKIARTIADLEQSINITEQHLIEAIQFREQNFVNLR